MNATAYRVTYSATWEWFEVVRSSGEIQTEVYEISGEDEWNTLLEIGNQGGLEVSPDDPEFGAMVVTEVSERHPAIMPGDLILNAGYGCPCLFIRPL